MSLKKIFQRTRSFRAAGFLSLAMFSASALADAPGRGMSSAFEVDFLRFTIDHHLAGLRMSELAAGTDAGRDAPAAANEGTSPTPGFNPVTAKATLEEVTSIARTSNRDHREQILLARRLLRDWYGVDHQPQISEINQARIDLLEGTPAGPDFDRLFLQVFTRHHFILTSRALEAFTSSDPDHIPLKRLARTMLDAQLSEIDEMRDLLCDRFTICDFQPYTGFKGRHAGDDPELERQFARFNETTNDEDEDGDTHPAIGADNADDATDQNGETGGENDSERQDNEDQSRELHDNSTILPAPSNGATTPP